MDWTPSSLNINTCPPRDRTKSAKSTHGMGNVRFNKISVTMRGSGQLTTLSTLFEQSVPVIWFPLFLSPLSAVSCSLRNQK